MLKRFSRLLVFGLIANVPASATITAATVYELRAAGANTQGGGFDATIASAGLDMSIFDNKNLGACSSCQSATVNISTTDAVAIGTSTITSAGANFSSDIVGNVVYFQGGTGAIAAVRRQVVTFTNSTTIVLDASIAASTTMTMNIGGAYLGGATTPLVLGTEVAGNTVYVKAGAYSPTATQTFSVAGTAGNPITYIAYTTTRTDGGQVTATRGSGNLTLFNITGAFRRFYGFIAVSGATGTQTGFAIGQSNIILVNCKATGFTVAGFNINATSSFCSLTNCWATAGTSAATAAFSMGNNSITGTIYTGCTANANACTGFLNTSTSTAARITYLRCIAANNTNSADGWKLSNAQSALISCISYNNGGAGVLLDTTTTATAGDSFTMVNSILASNTGYGVQSNTTDYTTSGKYSLLLDYNAFYNNTAGPRSKVPTEDHLFSLSGDPFVDGANMNFALDNTASEGAALRATGFPGVMQSGGTGYIDVGPLQHADPAGGGGQKGNPWVASARKVDPEMWAMIHPKFEAGIHWPFPAWLTGVWVIVIGVCGAALRRG